MALTAACPEDEFYLVSDQPFAMPPGEFDNLRRGGGPRNFLEKKWWLWGVDREMERIAADVFHGTDFTVPYLAHRPSVLTLHDLSPWLDPVWHHDADRVRARTPILLELGIPTMIVTGTEVVRKAAIERFRIHPSRVVAVPLAASARFRPQPEEAGSPYLLFTGTLEPRKNIPALIEAWREVRKQHAIDLVLAGRRRDDFPEPAAEPGLRILGQVPEQELARLYSSALALVYPSLYEGFGLPVLEAMQCGACVITSQDPALMEVAGDATVAVPATDPRALAGAMLAAVTCPEWRASRGQESLKRASQFSWARTACLTREVYEEARRRFG